MAFQELWPQIIAHVLEAHFKNIYLMHTDILSVCMSVYQWQALCLRSSKEVILFPETGVINGCERW